MIRSGYRRIAIITGAISLKTARERLRGYTDALREAKIKVDRSLILEGDFRQESGYRLAKEVLLRRNPPVAIFVCNGVMTLGVLQAFEEIGIRCPQDMALATFDDLAGDRSFHPRLTVVAQPGYEIGGRGATMLMDRVESKSRSKISVVRVAPILIIRESTRPSGSSQSSIFRPARTPRRRAKLS
jgi:DNA-binding LacI/PurR family transcriptional regulator